MSVSHRKFGRPALKSRPTRLGGAGDSSPPYELQPLFLACYTTTRFPSLMMSRTTYSDTTTGSSAVLSAPQILL